MTTMQGLEVTTVAVDELAAAPDLMHLVCCCNEDLALCGADVAGECWVEDGDECVVCHDLEALMVCLRCGHGAHCSCCACGRCRSRDEWEGGDTSCPGS